MDFQRKADLISICRRFGLDEKHPRGNGSGLPLVSLEAFFEGNDDSNSLGVNLFDEHPGLRFLQNHMLRIRDRPDVETVLVEIYDIEWALQEPNCWPFAEKVIFVTSAPEEEVREWAQTLMADGPLCGFPIPAAPNAPLVSSSSKAWHVVWD